MNRVVGVPKIRTKIATSTNGVIARRVASPPAELTPHETRVVKIIRRVNMINS